MRPLQGGENEQICAHAPNMSLTFFRHWVYSHHRSPSSRMGLRWRQGKWPSGSKKRSSALWDGARGAEAGRPRPGPWHVLHGRSTGSQVPSECRVAQRAYGCVGAIQQGATPSHRLGDFLSGKASPPSFTGCRPPRRRRPRKPHADPPPWRRGEGRGVVGHGRPSSRNTPQHQGRRVLLGGGRSLPDGPAGLRVPAEIRARRRAACRAGGKEDSSRF